LLFSYRSGTCGNGNILVKRFFSDQQKWEMYLKNPLFEGVEDKDNRAAYHQFIKVQMETFIFYGFGVGHQWLKQATKFVMQQLLI